MTNVTRRQQYQERRYSPENLDEVRPTCGRFRISYIVITCKYDATCQGAVALPLSNTHINRHWTHTAQIETPTDQRIKLPRIMSPFHADWPMLMLSSIATLSISFIWFVLFRAQPLAIDKVLCHWRWILCKALFWLLGQFLHSCSHLLCGFGLQVADVLTSSSFFYRLTVRRNANWFYIAYPHSKSFAFCCSWDTSASVHHVRNAMWASSPLFFTATQLQHHLCLHTPRILTGRIGCTILDIKACLLVICHCIRHQPYEHSRLLS